MNVNVPPGAIPNTAQPMEWPEGALTRIPYWIYQSPEIYALEQQRLFEGPVWNFLCLEAEVQKPGDYRVTFVGSMPVIVARDFDDEIYAFENRCAHRGALIALDQRRPRPRLHLRLSRLELRPERQPQGGRLRGRRQRQGRHGQDVLPRRPRAAQASHRQLLRPGVRLAVRRRAADRGISRRRGRGRIKRVLHKPVVGDRPLHPDAAEQLEALFRERQGHLSRLACCTRSSRRSASTGCRSAAAWW